MAISSPGLGSNLDVNGIVSQLMTIEQRPLLALNSKEASYQAKISAFGSLRSVLSSLQTASSALVPGSGQTAFEKFGNYKATVADTTIATATASSNVVAGSYSIEVTHLAKAQRVESVANPVITNGTLTLEVGTYSPAAPASPTSFTHKTGTIAKTITIDNTNNTIEGVRDAINSAAAGITATVVNGTGGKQLILESAFTGVDGAMRLSGTSGLVLDPSEATPDTLVEKVAARNAALTINGIAVSSATNTVTEAVDGLSINLLKEPEAPATSVSTTVAISRDTGTLSSSLNALVKAYNDANKTMGDLGVYDASTKKGGTLLGDSSLRSAQSAIRGVVNNVPAGLSGTYTRLADIGLTVKLDGSMALDTAKLNKAISADYVGVANLVAAYGAAFKSTTEALAGTGGALVQRADGLADSIKLVSKQREVLSQRLITIESRYRKQFTSLDTLISGLTKTSSFLQQQLANLPNSGG